jgi:hypothetical protein
MLLVFFGLLFLYQYNKEKYIMKFEEIIARLKEIISQNLGSKKIYDKDVAMALKLDPQYFAVIKKRKKIPFEAIAYFSYENHKNINWILFGNNNDKPKIY